jgi:histidinol-phosphate aminotransferase
MRELRPIHGGTDSQTEPRYDFSSNANPLGPCPSVLAAIRRADITRYPDPLYTGLRDELAAFHGASADRVVIGAGASELILRLIRRCDGPVHQLAPTFSEYARGAHLTRRRVLSAHSPPAFLRAQSRHPGLGFLCWPNNPTGDEWPLEFVAAAAAAGPLVVDLAYAPLTAASDTAAIERAAARAYRLYSPNKSFGLTGVRGAYLIAPRIDRRLALDAPSWVIGRDAVGLLHASSQRRAQLWLEESLPRVHRWRSQLARSLHQLGLSVRDGPATFLLARVGDASRVASRLRGYGVRVRDCTSFGMPEWLRLSAQRPAAQKALLAALDRAL